MKTKQAIRPKRIDVNPFDIARRYVEDTLDFPTDLKSQLLGKLRSRDLPGLMAECEKGPEFHGPEAWLKLRQVSCFFSKNDSFDNPDCLTKAYENFLYAEEVCSVTNSRIEAFVYDEQFQEFAEPIERMRADIARLLPSVRKTFLPTLPEKVRLTSGATEDRSRRRAIPFLKISGKIRAPEGCFKYLRPLLQFFGVEPDSWKPIATSFNRVAFVLKNWRTRRGIAAEPTHSLPLQLAAGTFLGRRLKRWGVDLWDQTLSQEAARIGSLDGSIATLDAKQASDMLATNAVALLLPDDWFVFLDDLRSKCFKLPNGETGVYAKFSSMGNGFTFPLESLIFSAACRALDAPFYRVYGDDIAVSTTVVERLTGLLSFLGFTMNKEKSFSSSEFLFRESCGTDWYRGKNVTTWKLRTSGEVHQSTFCHIANALLALSVPGGALWSYTMKLVHKHRLPFVPYNTDTRSGIFISPHDAHRLGIIMHDKQTPWIPYFRGFGPRPCIRRNHGWRSLFLWHIASRGTDPFGPPVPFHPAIGLSGDVLLHVLSDVLSEKLTVGSIREVHTRVRYSHQRRHYTAVRGNVPLHLYLIV